MEALNKTLAKLPIIPALLAYCAYLGYVHHDWMNAADSELGNKKATVEVLRGDIEASNKKLAQGEEFFRNLDAIRTRIRTLTAQLESTKAHLSADIDIANFVRMITLESKKLGVAIKSITPNTDVKRNYYTEVPFKVSMRGAYVQIMMLFDRIARFQQVIRVSDFDLKPSGSSFTKYVELNGNATIVAYKYLGTTADNVIHKAEMKSTEKSETQ